AHFREPLAHGKEARAAEAVFPDGPDVVGSHRHVGSNFHAELVRLDVLRLEAGVIEVERFDLVQVLAADLEQHGRAGLAAEGEDAVEANVRQLGVTGSAESKEKEKSQTRNSEFHRA